MTGCWLVLEIQLRFTLPTLHEYVPSEIASMPPEAELFSMSCRSPTMTSGPLRRHGYGAAPTLIVKVPDPPPTPGKDPNWITYCVPLVALKLIVDCRPQVSSLHAIAPAPGQAEAA